MSLDKLIDIIGACEYKQKEHELINIMPIAMRYYGFGKSKNSKWTPDVATNMLILRYGLNGNNNHTLQQLGDIYVISRERVRSIESKALRLIRRYLQNVN